jgi:ABC-type proline/glycine betaine transport system permease subunit
VGEKGDLMLADTANLHTFVDAFRFIGDNPSFLLQKAWEQLVLSGAALGLALLVALPLGIALGHLHRGSGFAIGASIFGRGLPSLVLIAAFLTILGIGFVNNMVALAVLATGPILTNAYDSVEGVDRDAVEAARGMGMTGLQVLRRRRARRHHRQPGELPAVRRHRGFDLRHGAVRGPVRSPTRDPDRRNAQTTSTY